MIQQVSLLVLLVFVSESKGQEPHLVVGTQRFEIYHISSQSKAGSAPYLDFSEIQWNNPRNLQKTLQACKKQCLTLTACEYGTYITEGDRKNECWLSAHRSAKMEPCGVPCQSFKKKTAHSTLASLHQRLSQSHPKYSRSQDPQSDDDDFYAKVSIFFGIMLGLGFMAMSAFKGTNTGHGSYSRIAVDKRNRSLAETDEDDGMYRQTHSPVSMLEEDQDANSDLEKYRV